MDELKVIYEDMVKELIYDANHKRVKNVSWIRSKRN